MAVGNIPFPGFTNSHTISNRRGFYQCAKAVNVITGITDNDININDYIAPSQIDKNKNGETVRFVYTGQTSYNFLLTSSEKAFAIEIENTGGGNITSAIIQESINGYNWFQPGTNLITTPIAPNKSQLIKFSRGTYPNGVHLLLQIVCASTSLVSVQGV